MLYKLHFNVINETQYFNSFAEMKKYYGIKAKSLYDFKEKLHELAVMWDDGRQEFNISVIK